MLPVSHRLRRSEDFRRVFRLGTKVNNDVGLVVIAPSESPHARLGVVVSAKVGGAVVRNALKRRLRHIFASQLGLLAPVDVVVRCGDRAAGLDYSQMSHAVITALSRAGARP